MANQYYQNFLYSPTKLLTGIHGSISMTTQVKAALTAQEITYTAVAFGAGGNSITVTVVSGSPEAVVVSGNAITITVTGASSVDSVVATLLASAAVTALVDVTGSGSDAVVAATVLPLTGGVTGITGYSILGVASVSQTGVGEITVTLSKAYPAMQLPRFTILSATAQDRIAQVKSINMATGVIVFRLLAGATATDPTSDITIYMNLMIRGSTVIY